MRKNFRLLRARHLRVGRTGENIACRLLKAKFCKILARNYKCKAGEIDIVAREGSTLLFVEVKTRYHTTKARPAEGLSTKQKKRILNAGRHYIRQIDNPKVTYRFDLIEIRLGRFIPVEVRQWKNHFSGRTLRKERSWK